MLKEPSSNPVTKYFLGKCTGILQDPSCLYYQFYKFCYEICFHLTNIENGKDDNLIYCFYTLLVIQTPWGLFTIYFAILKLYDFKKNTKPIDEEIIIRKNTP